MGTLPSDPDELIRTFCDRWSDPDLDDLLAFFAEDAVYHNIPLEPAVGHDAIRGVLAMMLDLAQSVRFEIRHQVTAGGIVMNERVDTLVMGERTVALPVAGVFEVADGKIQAWRDYFDMAQFTGA